MGYNEDMQEWEYMTFDLAKNSTEALNLAANTIAWGGSAGRGLREVGRSLGHRRSGRQGKESAYRRCSS